MVDRPVLVSIPARGRAQSRPGARAYRKVYRLRWLPVAAQEPLAGAVAGRQGPWQIGRPAARMGMGMAAFADEEGQLRHSLVGASDSAQG